MDDVRVGNAATRPQAMALHRTGTALVAPSASPTGSGAAHRSAGKAGAAAGRGACTDAELRNACKELESVFLLELLKEMRKTVPKDDLFGGGRGEDVFQSMFDQEIAKKMAERGGIGLAEVLYRQLSQQAAPPSRLGGHSLGNSESEKRSAEG